MLQESTDNLRDIEVDGVMECVHVSPLTPQLRVCSLEREGVGEKWDEIKKRGIGGKVHA